MSSLHTFAERYRLAVETALQETPESGTNGCEMEWNLLDSELRPLLTVGSGPVRQSFVDYLCSTHLSPAFRAHSQLEVFHWMTEWVTRPYYTPRGAVYEARLLEGALINALHAAGEAFGERLYYRHGNLLYLTQVDFDSIPATWPVAKRRYLERCVALYGDALATAGNHTNLSLPAPLLAWDFMHLPPAERGKRRLEDYQNEVYISAARVLRAFAALFIACTASTPFQAVLWQGRPAVRLTDFDSVRNLTFPNPPALDAADLYRSHADYLHISTDLVRRGVRFGNNNWTPTRARSYAPTVEQQIAITSQQLRAIYARGLYALGESPQPLEDMARDVEIENLLTRLRIPMSRVEVRTDDGGNSLELDVANLTLKHLLLLRLYADPEFGRSFRYDQEDIRRARRNEQQAARDGLRAEIENPFTGKPVTMRAFLRWTLQAVAPLAEALGWQEDLAPLEAMAGGAPNTAEQVRQALQGALLEDAMVPVEALRALADARQQQVLSDVAKIVETRASLGGEAAKLEVLIHHGRLDTRRQPRLPVRFQSSVEPIMQTSYPAKEDEIVALASQLVAIPSVTACPDERVDEVYRAAAFIFDYLNEHGVPVRLFNQSRYPAVLASFPAQTYAPVMLCGHFDVVPPEPDDGQFTPRREGDYLWGRGTADMKTVVATCLVWMKDTLQAGPPYPPISLLLIGNEENGEEEPMGTRHVLAALAEEQPGYAPRLLIAGERTEESGSALWGEVCIQNRGVLRATLTAHGVRGHSGTGGGPRDLTDRLAEAREAMQAIFSRRLTLSSPDGWCSQARFPFMQVGTPGVYNITADSGVLGVEVRPIPQDDVPALVDEMRAWCTQHDIGLEISVCEAGVACDPQNPYLACLTAAVAEVSGAPARLGRKLAGTSARFAPGGQGVVWGQSGIGPHSAQERHYIPSIEPYYHALQAFARHLQEAALH
ncbi:MAG: hypothetical protein Fur0018_06050 [Anaerolineales bacterium]